MTQEQLNKLFKQWCTNTKRSGGILTGRSIQEFFDYVEIKTHPKTDGLHPEIKKYSNE